MHIPDGFLDNRICLATGAVSAAAVGSALRRLRPEAEPGLVPRMGLTAAYVFAAQMVNFPVAAGTSGHLLGGLLAAVLLGPHAASVVMACVFLIQAFFFLDGGHTALGANVLNMGLAGTYGGYAVYRALLGSGSGSRRQLWAAGVAAWIAVVLGAALTSTELALSGTVSARLVFPAMLGVHALIGLGEAAITVAALGLLSRVRPDLLSGTEPAGSKSRWAWTAGGGLVLVAALAPFASSAPDGLDRVAGSLGFAGRAGDPMFGAFAPDYRLPLVGNFGWAPTAASLAGAALLLAAVSQVLRLGSHPSGRPLLPPLDARTKLLGSAALILSAVLIPPGSAGKLLFLALIAGMWVAAARVSAGWLAGRCLLLLPFVGLAALSSPAVRGGAAAALPFYGLIFLRAGISLLATAAVAATTPEPELLDALHAARMPHALTGTLAFALRYLRLLREEASRMLLARACRAGSGTLALRAASTGGIVGSLFLRSFERAERVSLAMAARGFNGRLPASERGRFSSSDGLFLAGLALLMTGVWMWP